ncbi:hypothetical protein EAF00_009221 [Botryotinia globosa]|nr:hypothetical protein EAF00_009221 [Botryotinia globosa]
MSMRLACLIPDSLTFLHLLASAHDHRTNPQSLPKNGATSQNGIKIWGGLLGTKQGLWKLLHADVEQVPVSGIALLQGPDGAVMQVLQVS